MRKFPFIIAIVMTCGSLHAIQDTDLRQKSSVQLRAIAAGLRKEVEAGKANLAKANGQISNLDDWAKAQWQRAEDEKAKTSRAQRRLFGGFLLGAGLGGIGVGLLLRRNPVPAVVPEPKVVKVRVSKSSSDRKAVRK